MAGSSLKRVFDSKDSVVHSRVVGYLNGIDQHFAKLGAKGDKYRFIFLLEDEPRTVEDLESPSMSMFPMDSLSNTMSIVRQSFREADALEFEKLFEECLPELESSEVFIIAVFEDISGVLKYKLRSRERGLLN